MHTVSERPAPGNRHATSCNVARPAVENAGIDGGAYWPRQMILVAYSCALGFLLGGPVDRFLRFGHGQDGGFFLVLDKGNALELAFLAAHYLGKHGRLGVAVADFVLLDEVTLVIVFHVGSRNVVGQTHILSASRQPAGDGRARSARQARVAWRWSGVATMSCATETRIVASSDGIEPPARYEKLTWITSPALTCDRVRDRQAHVVVEPVDGAAFFLHHGQDVLGDEAQRVDACRSFRATNSPSQAISGIGRLAEVEDAVDRRRRQVDRARMDDIGLVELHDRRVEAFEIVFLTASAAPP